VKWYVNSIIYDRFLRRKTSGRYDFFSEFEEQPRNGINYTMIDIERERWIKKSLLVVDFNINAQRRIHPFYRVIHQACSPTPSYFPLIINSNYDLCNCFVCILISKGHIFSIITIFYLPMH